MEISGSAPVQAQVAVQKKAEESNEKIAEKMIESVDQSSPSRENRETGKAVNVSA